jgi:CTP synthase
MLISVYISAGLIAASSGQLGKVLLDCSSDHAIRGKHQLNSGPYVPAVHLNGHSKKLANGLSNGTYYPNGNGVHA